MKTRMQPIGVVWNKLPRRGARSGDLARQADPAGNGWTPRPSWIGPSSRPSKTRSPTSCATPAITASRRRRRASRAGKPAHGRLTLRAFHEGGQVNIEIADDGAGIDVAACRSTRPVEKGLHAAGTGGAPGGSRGARPGLPARLLHRATVTNVSGRGVGMDVVKTNIEKYRRHGRAVQPAGEGTTLRSGFRSRWPSFPACW